MEEQKSEKTARVLGLYTKLLNGHILNKNVESNLYGVNERSIERDIESLRLFLAEQHLMQDVVYDRKAHGYRLVNRRPASLSNSEILAVCKILLESRSMRRDEMMPILDKLIDCCVPEESKRAVTDLIANEKYHYIQPHHGKNVLPGLWELGQAIDQHRVIEIEYERMKEPKLVRRRVQPVGDGQTNTERYSYNYDHFSYEDSERYREAVMTCSRIDAVRKYAGGDIGQYKREVSDHVPIMLSIDLK